MRECDEFENSKCCEANASAAILGRRTDNMKCAERVQVRRWVTPSLPCEDGCVQLMQCCQCPLL
jgi:hypothetical protein